MGRLERIRAGLNPPKETLGARMRRWVGRLVRLSGVLALVGLLGIGCAGVGGATWFNEEVVGGERLSRDQIMGIIAQESPIYYSDGQTRIGVFFAQEHRQYVPWAVLAKTAWVDAIVAAEDQRFWEHGGVDVQGIGRAMLQNLKAGKLVAGGSSLTQQTAKNLFYRPDRSLGSKLEELEYALKLEENFTKEEILEFYANQFHVSANGRGIAIAARYFFDKEVEELDELECAYIAGMVKGPANYNPWTGSTEEKREKARQRAKARTRYVLDRMLAMGKLSNTRHAELIDRDIPFKRGVFRYDSSVLIDEVAARLEQAPFPEVFARLGISNPSTAGIQIVTTLDAAVQREATWALWHHLSELGPTLEPTDAAQLLLPNPSENPEPITTLEVHGFYEGIVLAEPGPNGEVRLDLGGRTCRVDKVSVNRMAGILASSRQSSAGKEGTAADKAAVQELLIPGNRLLVSVRSIDNAGVGTCDLERRPTLQGGLLLLENSAIRAMVGGNDNRNFNRATAAKRQLGSTWKPLLYQVALHLGWAPTDTLDNRPAVFPFEGSWYAPRADHDPAPAVSLNQAGVKSENLASIWLLYHLLDHLDSESFQALAKALKLVPEAYPDREQWVARIRDDFGVISTPGRIDELAFYAARQERVRELGRNHPHVLDLQALLHGKGAAAEEAKVRRNDPKSPTLTALRWNYARLEAEWADCVGPVETLGEWIKEADGGALGKLGSLVGIEGGPPPIPDAATFVGVSVRESAGTWTVACGSRGAGFEAVDQAVLERLRAAPPTVWPDTEETLLDGRLPAQELLQLGKQRERMALVLGSPNPYDFEVLQHHPDFRAVVAMEAMAAMARTLGVESRLPPVLSMPLGAVDITLEEAALLYQGLGDGKQYRWVAEIRDPDATFVEWETVGELERPTLLIQEIRSAEGEVLFRARPVEAEVASPVAGRLHGDILRNVVLHGTGARARSSAKVGNVAVPLAGKTGTTNGFKNAAFAGFIPKANEGEWTWGQGYTLAAYVGFDDNTPMRRGSVRVAGASGALPAWMGTAAGLATSGRLGTSTQSDLRTEGGYSRVPVAKDTGLPVRGNAGDHSVLVRGAGWIDDELDVERLFDLRPFQIRDGATNPPPPDHAVPEVAVDPAKVEHLEEPEIQEERPLDPPEPTTEDDAPIRIIPEEPAIDEAPVEPAPE